MNYVDETSDSEIRCSNVETEKLNACSLTHSSSVRASSKKTKINIIWLTIPAFFDFIGCTMMYVSLTQVAASVYQMMKGISIVYVGLLSLLFLKRKMYCHHWSSMLTVTLGVCVVGIASLIATDNDSTSISGILILLPSHLFIAIKQISEEKILSGYNLDPFFLVGV